MSNKVKAMSHSIIDVGGKIGLGGVSGRYKGTASTLWKIGGCLIGIGVIGIYVLPEIKRKLGQVKIDEKKKKNELENDKAREVSRLKMEEKDHQCDLDIKKAKEISQVKTDEISRVITIRQDFGLMGKKTVGEQTIDKEPALGEWLQWFDTQFPMPGYSAIPHISTILNGCPGGFRPAMLLHLLGTYGALCFSNVRAQYMDGRSHSPSLQVVIVGAQGSGKSIFKNVYEQDLFHRVVMEAREKSRSDKPDQIIQTIGSEISKARLLELIAGNHDIKNLRQNYTKYFEQITMQMHIEVDKQKIYLNHCPFLCYGGVYRDTWQLFGHVHTSRYNTGKDVPRWKMLFPKNFMRKIAKLDI